MRTLEKFNDKNLSLFLGLIGFAILFIVFSFDMFTELSSPGSSSTVMETYAYSSYSLFFAKSDKPYFSVLSPIFFAFFLVNFLFYLLLLVLRIAKNDNKKTLYLGVIGIMINLFTVILFYVFLFESWLNFDYNDFWALLITFEFLGLFVSYASWLYTCKKSNTLYETPQVDKSGNVYLILSAIEIVLFIFPIIIILAFLFILLVPGMVPGNSKNNRTTKQFVYNKKDDTITIDKTKYAVKDNKIFDIKTNKEVGYLDNDKAIFDVKRN